MIKFQKFILNPLTALLFAWGAFAFISHYDLLQIPYVEWMTAAWIVVGYLLFSRKYDLSLSVIFFLGAIFVGYKAYHIPVQSQFSVASDQQVARKLILLADYKKQQPSIPVPQNIFDSLNLKADDIVFVKKGSFQIKNNPIQNKDYITYNFQNNVFYASYNGDVHKLNKKTGDILPVSP